MMIAGFAFGATQGMGWLKSLIVPFTFLMVHPMMVTLKIKKVFEGGDAKAHILTQLISCGLIPFLAFGVAHIFFW